MEISPFIPITSDYGFKVTFGNASDTLFLRVALQALINSPVPIREVQFEKTTFEAITRESRAGIYDVACTDEHGNQFIVEMQLAHAPEFLQRMKFYALHKFNTLVERGDFRYEKLPRIYCIALLDKSTLPGSAYRTVVNLRNEQGELLDSQLTFILVELAKFNLPATAIHTDLEKLLYTMKTLHTASQPTQYPEFWNEEWLRVALNELNTRNLSPEDRAAFARAIAIKAEGVNAERRRVEDLVRRMLLRGKLSVEEIAEDAQTTVQLVLDIQAELAREK
jgi:predicted transposase/invertase (TIGR01784 family)